ncbi:hypothetical protein [Paenibacillus elgii]|uniref:hypothetical protein n=1 Tax=Paenibacillus elgii TaxID=189691 RepID=UPI002040AB2C|nr:hypothetical protein [Paenibacillus elgii]MCM3270852.1 hypothetical protein [Paenibacillus elgii]
MKGLDRTFLIGAMLLVIGVVWAFTLNGIGTKEWILLLAVTVLGIAAGVVQGRVIFLNKRGQIGSGKMKLWIVGTLIVFVALKVAMNMLIPSYLATSGNGIWLSIVFVIGGLLLGRSFYSRLR